MKIKYTEGQTVRKWRRRRDLTQGELAKILGVHTQFISNIERGICGVPVYRFLDFCHALNMAPRYLIAPKIRDYRKQLERSTRAFKPMPETEDSDT